MTGLQEAIPKQWVDGDFLDDWTSSDVVPTEFDKVPLQRQPEMLDKAALHYCLADTFHPGCEMTWPMRHASLYTAPFRIRERHASEPEPDYGAKLTPLSAAMVGALFIPSRPAA
ncbi:LodA/GoxA family CTQ-dependent oxidase [Sinorhizobium meliloti]|uniref:LodA/GoxA family CTQ-dependent oxidase n=1 Tax=Rhizobium meliloti TaxID=382 RepID=UPI00067E98C2|nr:LodA/GoxA family CTQ-dependent oxidase [Sinorhizobium meliloti]